jgi:uncharacterized Ntn-hydrolase superfamily protein
MAGLRAATLGLLLSAAWAAPAFATWSIVAVDPETREVGYAAASCTADVHQIGALVPDRGALVSQAMMNEAGRVRGATLLRASAEPEEILAYLTSPDFDRSRGWSWWSGAQVRQYGVATLEPLAAASFTGQRTTSWSGDSAGQEVTVQGNILWGEEIVADARAAFEGAAGCDLSDRLLRALEAGAQAGGDRRCVRELTALTAAIEVAGPRDPADRPALQLRITRENADLGVRRSIWHLMRPFRGTAQENPVVQLRAAYDAWRGEHPPRRGACGAASGRSDSRLQPKRETPVSAAGK